MDRPASYDETTERFTEGLARICGIYGINPLIGRIYGVLFLSPCALTLDELCEQVGAAKSTVSVTVRKLVDVRVVRRFWKKGDRRDHFEPVTEPQLVMDELMRAFVKPELEVWNEIVEMTTDALGGAAGEGWPSTAERLEVLRRVESVQRFVGAWERALQTLELPEPPEPAIRIDVEFE